MATNWTNPNGGDWNTAGNWDNGIPSTTNQALINSNVLSANGKSITFSALAQCMGLTITGTKTFTISSAVYSLELYGNFVGSTNCTFAMTGTAYVYSKATQTITTNGKALVWNRWYIDGVGITVTNGDAITLSSAIWIVNGTWATNDKTISSTGEIVCSGGTVTWGASAISCAYLTLVSSTTVVTSGTYTVTTGVNGFVINRAITFYNLIINGDGLNGTIFQPGGSTFNNVTINSGSGIAAISPNNNCTISGVFTIVGYATKRTLFQSSVLGTPRTITCNGTTNITNCDFQDITLAGTANRDFSARTDIGDCGGNSGITFPPAIDCYIKHTSGAMSVSNAAKWVTTDGGSTQARVPLPQDQAWGKASSFTGVSTVTMDCPRIGSIDLSGVNQAVTWTLGNAITVYKSYRMGTNITQTGNFAISYLGDRSTNGSVYLGSNHPNKFNVILSNTFNSFTIDPSQKAYFTAGTTQTINTPLDATGTAANPIAISGVTAAPFTLNYTGTSFIHCDWLILTNCVVSNVGKWFAGKNSVNGGGNTNWLWRRYISTPIITLIRKL